MSLNSPYISLKLEHHCRDWFCRDSGHPNIWRLLTLLIYKANQRAALITQQSNYSKFYSIIELCFFHWTTSTNLESHSKNIPSQVWTFKTRTWKRLHNDKNANARTSHCMHCMHAYTYMYRTYRRVHTRFSSNMKESLHTYAGLAELIINQRFINSSSVKRAIDILIIIRMNELSR